MLYAFFLVDVICFMKSLFCPIIQYMSIPYHGVVQQHLQCQQRAVRGSLDGCGDGNVGRQVGAIDFEFTPNLRSRSRSNGHSQPWH